MTVTTPFQTKKDRIRARLNKYSVRAFRLLPPMDKPRILDVGCGSGISTLELAKLSNGAIVALDIDESVLNQLRERFHKAGLSDRIETRHGSLLDMDFPEASFDIIWAEGSISVIGFQRGLREWQCFLKPKGFMVIHDAQGNIPRKLEQIADCGYELLGYFTLGQDVWLAEYFTPLEKLIRETKAGHADDPQIREELQSAQWELDTFRKDPENNSSVCFVMQKK